MIEEKNNNLTTTSLESVRGCPVDFIRNNINLLVLIIIFSYYFFSALYFSIHHVYLEWDEIILKIAGRKYLGEPGHGLFYGEVGIFKAPLFSLLLGLAGSNDFFVVAVAAILNFLLVGVLLSHVLDGLEKKPGYLLLGLALFSFSYQVQHYFIVFYAETLSITFILLSVVLYIRKKSPLLIAVICFCAFLTRINLLILFVFFPFCYLISNQNKKYIFSFLFFVIFLFIIYFVVEVAFTGDVAKAFTGMYNKVQGPNQWIIENKLLSISFYFIVLFDLLGLFNGILFYLAAILVLWKKIVKGEVPELIRLSFILILFFIASLTMISAKSDRFLLPVLPFIVVVNIWALSVFWGGLASLLKIGRSNVCINSVFGFVSIVLILSSLGYFSVFKYSPLLSRKFYSFSEPREFSSPRERFFWRMDSEKARLVRQHKIVHYLNSSPDDLIIYSDLAYHYVYANFGHKIVSVKTKKMEKADLDIDRIDPEDIPKGSFFLGRHDFSGSKLLGRVDSVKGVIIN